MIQGVSSKNLKNLHGRTFYHRSLSPILLLLLLRLLYLLTNIFPANDLKRQAISILTTLLSSTLGFVPTDGYIFFSGTHSAARPQI